MRRIGEKLGLDLGSGMGMLSVVKAQGYLCLNWEGERGGRAKLPVCMYGTVASSAQTPVSMDAIHTILYGDPDS